METFNKPTYPRPDFARESWESLDGEWEFDLGERFQTAEEALGSDFEEKIQVPFCYQSQASGIGRTEDRDTVWYRREFRLSPEQRNGSVQLHFGAVDYEAQVWVNGRCAGTHRGGHTSFSFDITYLVEEKTIVESGQAASKDMEERSGKKTEKSPESILQKTHERPEKVQPEKNSEKPEKTDKIEKKEEKTGRFEKIKCTIVKFCDKIKHTVGHAEEKLESLSEKKDKIIKELEDPVHQKAFSKAKKETGKLLKRWKPKVIKGTVRFGFEDPCHTGQALAAFSIIYPFIGEFLSIEPNFERRILKGDVKVRGGFRMVPLVCFLWNLVWCREIRKTYHDIREFQL